MAQVVGVTVPVLPAIDDLHGAEDSAGGQFTRLLHQVNYAGILAQGSCRTREIHGKDRPRQ